MTQTSLFEMTPVEAPPPLSIGARRTVRQATTLAAGWHPLGTALSPLRLHLGAAPIDDRTAAGRRCGNCAHRALLDYHTRTYGKCLLGEGSRVTHGAATDVRRWWPGCVDHEWGDPDLSDDAARWAPEETS